MLGWQHRRNVNNQHWRCVAIFHSNAAVVARSRSLLPLMALVGREVVFCVIACLLGRSVGSFVCYFFAFVIIVFSCLFVSKKNTNSFNPQNDPRQRGKPKHLPSVLRDDMTAGWRWWWWRSFVIASVAASTHVWLQCFSLRFMRFVLLFSFLWYFVFLWLFRQIPLHHSRLFVVDVPIVVSIYRRICLLSIRSSVGRSVCLVAYQPTTL